MAPCDREAGGRKRAAWQAPSGMAKRSAAMLSPEKTPGFRDHLPAPSVWTQDHEARHPAGFHSRWSCLGRGDYHDYLA